jgi:SAM-dependent methyltransferase
MLHAAVIFVSAFLIFLVQPLIAKQILPWFGGSAAVWATCLLFFQTALLAGYAYAHALTQWLSLRRQVFVHAALLLLACVTMPILVDAYWRPTGQEEPISRILLLLGATIGLPYFLLATTTPLVGAWYARRYQAAAPYRLFALSNFASLLALLGFPFLIEPTMGNRETALGWSALFVVFALLCTTLAWRTLRAVAQDAPAAPARGMGEGEGHGRDSVSTVTEAQARAGDAGRWPAWVAFSAIGSALLLGVSSHLTQNISSAPLLWVVPLALYLVTFIVSFDHPRWYHRGVFLPLAAAVLPLMAWLADSLELGLVTPVYAAGLFVLCMVCHGELYRLKPEPARLTQFYLAISVGGALGSLLMAVAAPLLLDGHYEFYGALAAAAALGLALRIGSRPSGKMAYRAAAAAVLVGVAALGWRSIDAYARDVRFMARDFYGVVRTRDSDTGGESFRTMFHGGIAHGGQLLRPDLQMTASSYFGPTSGYGRVFASLPEGPRRVGIIGLGAGALAAYARPGDHWVFYEISPAVVQAARQEFSFLRQMPGTHEVVLGDGRLALDRESPRQFDVIAMDAFAGDSIPSHLITREAMAIYLKHLKPGGVIVFQATNRFVDPMPVIRRLADTFGLQAVLVSDSPSYDTGEKYWLSLTDQVVVTRNRALLEAQPLREAAVTIQPRPELPVFTDDYVNLLKILKR